MLFKKTVKAASAAALWMGALLGANSAMAVLSFDDPASNTPIVFAAETLEGAGPTYVVTATGEDLVAQIAFGVLAGTINKSNDIYVRLDVGGTLALGGAPTMNVGTAPDPIAAISGGEVLAADVSFDARAQMVIYTIDLAGGRTNTDLVQLTFGTGTTTAVTGVGHGTVQLRAYDEIREAIKGGSDTLFNKDIRLLSVDRALKVKALKSHASRTATVASGFTRFENKPTGGMSAIAALELSVACHRDRTGTLLLGTDASTPCSATEPAGFVAANVKTGTGGSTIMLSGDGGFDFAGDAANVALYPGEGTGTDFDPCGGTPSTVSFKNGADGKPNLAGTATASVPGTPGRAFVCVDIKATSAERIPEGTYEADVSVVADSTTIRPFPPKSEMDLEVGMIEHDGTTVNIPYLTSHEGYTQRLVIVNRNKSDVSYTLAFHTEGDGTADPAMLEGMLMGEMTTVIKVGDQATFMNPTRAAGTLEIVSSPTMIDVATTMVNKMDDSTDTVVLHLGKRDG